MKLGKLIFLLIVISILAACGETPTPVPTTPTTPAEPTQPAEPTPPTPTAIFTGTLSQKSSRGAFTIVQTGNQRSLTLSSDFKANGLQNVDLWLAKDATGTDFVELPGLKIEGAQTFDVPTTLDLSVYSYVVVWCAEAKVVIGYAPLETAAPGTSVTPPVAQTLFNGTLTEKSSRGSFNITQTGGKRFINLASDFKANGLNNIDLWLAKDDQGANYIEFSDIKITGAQTFELAATVDLAVYKYVIVWCDDVDVIIGLGELEAAN